MTIRKLLTATAALAAAHLAKLNVLNRMAERLHQQEPGDCEFFWHQPTSGLPTAG